MEISLVEGKRVLTAQAGSCQGQPACANLGLPCCSTAQGCCGANPIMCCIPAATTAPSTTTARPAVTTKATTAPTTKPPSTTTAPATTAPLTTSPVTTATPTSAAVTDAPTTTTTTTAPSTTTPATTTSATTSSGSGASTASVGSKSGSTYLSWYNNVTADRSSSATGKTKKKSATGTCGYYSDLKCRRPRSCYDCLNTVVNGHSCVIDPTGLCVQETTYDSTKDFRRPVGTSYQAQNFYPSSNATYCEKDDQYCTKCQSAWASNATAQSDIGMMPFCRGENGCVCIRNCEIPTAPSKSTKCVTTASTGSLHKPDVTTSLIPSGIIIGLLGVVWINFYRTRWRRERMSDANSLGFARDSSRL